MNTLDYSLRNMLSTWPPQQGERSDEEFLYIGTALREVRPTVWTFPFLEQAGKQKKKKKNQDFRRKSGHFLLFWCPYSYCLTRDITVPAHLVIVLVDIWCRSENKTKKSRQLGPLGLFSVHFGPLFMTKIAHFPIIHVVWRYFLDKKKSFSSWFSEARNKICRGCSSW